VAEIAEIHAGPVFRYINVHGRLHDNPLGSTAQRYILKRRCEQAGLRPDYYGLQSLEVASICRWRSKRRYRYCRQACRNSRMLMGLQAAFQGMPIAAADAPRSIDEERPTID